MADGLRFQKPWLVLRHVPAVPNSTVGAAGAATLRCDAYPLRAAPDV